MDIELEVVHATPPDTLYHYTSHDAAVAIMSTRSVWATHIAYLNDQEELHHAVKQIRRLVDDEMTSSTDSRFREFHEQLVRGLETITETNLCVFSLSESHNLLSQWRAYCPRGVGYAIGFDSIALAGAVSVERAQLGKCIYDADTQEVLLSQLVRSTIRRFEAALDSEPDFNSILVEQKLQFMRNAARVAAYVKHDAFAEEREWRLVSRSFGDSYPLWGFRSGRVSMIPHLVLPAAEADERVRLNAAVVGPSPDPGSALKSARLFFGAQGLLSQFVNGSRIPFRSW